MTLDIEMNSSFQQSVPSTPECAICEDVSHGVHFGVNVCRACAAFFRRSTITNRTYVCRFGGGCQIDIRCSCRACRMDKCLKMGMDPNGVQRYRDQIGPRQQGQGGESPKRKRVKQSKRVSNTFNNLKSEVEVGILPKDMIDDEESTCSSTLNAIHQPMDTSSQTGGSVINSPICPPFSNLQLLGINLRRNIEDNSSNYNEAKSYTVLTSAHHPARKEGGNDVASAFMMENVLLTALRNAGENSGHGGGVSSVSSGFCSASSFNSQQQSPSSPRLSLSSCFNTTASSFANCAALAHATSEWDNRPSTSSAFQPVDDQQQTPSTITTTTNDSLKSLETVDSRQSTPYLTQMLRGYRKFLCLRKTASNLNSGGSLHRLFDDNDELVEGTYADNVISLKNDLSLVSDMINDHFQPLGSFSTSSKWALLRNFFCPFVMTERSYRSVKYFPNKEDTRFVISSRHYTDFKNLRSFFDVDSCKVDPNRMASIFKPTFFKLSNMLAKPMRDLGLSEDELVGLMGLTLWNDKADGLSEEEVKLIDKTRESIHNELYYVCRKQANGDLAAGAIRFGTICNLVHLVHKCAQELAANFSLANVTNSFEIDTFLHSFTPHAW